MARPLKPELAGGLYHITACGDGREAIYLDDADRQDWLALPSEVYTRFQWRRYCLITNHYHILLETPETNLSRGMRQFEEICTQHIAIRIIGIMFMYCEKVKQTTKLTNIPRGSDVYELHFCGRESY